jgi:hypothetical protein
MADNAWGLSGSTCIVNVSREQQHINGDDNNTAMAMARRQRRKQPARRRPQGSAQ